MAVNVTQQDKAKAALEAMQAHEGLAALEARELFIEVNAIQAETSGLPRIAGRLIGIFLLDGGPISFAQLAERPKKAPACGTIRPGYRRCSVERHMIYFRITAYGIAIIRVLHDRMEAQRNL